MPGTFCEDISNEQVNRKGRGKEAVMKYLEVMKHLQSFDETSPEMQRLAIHLAVVFYRSTSLAMTKHFADNYKA